MATSVPTLESFRAHLREPEIQILRIISLAIRFALLVLVVVAAVLHVNAPEADPSPQQIWLAQVLTIVALVISLILFVVSSQVFSRLVGRDRLEAQLGRLPEQTSEAVRVGVLVGLLRTAEIIRHVLMETGALFGFVVAVIAITSGVMRTQPLYWVNLFPALLVIMLLTLTAPSRDRLERLFREASLS